MVPFDTTVAELLKVNHFYYPTNALNYTKLVKFYVA